jgi:C4-dicarboxylate-specific signal transduction histidine kinase
MAQQKPSLLKDLPPTKPHWRSNPHTLLKCGVTVVSVASAVILAWLMWRYWHTEAFASLFFCAIMLSAWFGGFRQGLLAVAVSVLAFDYYLLPPVHSFHLESGQLPRLTIFAVSALIIGFITASQRSTAESLRRARDNLAANVQDLERTNVELRVENAERKLAQAALRRSQAYLAEAQRLSHAGSFGWRVSRGEVLWSEESFRIFQYERTATPTVELILQRTHPEEATFVKETMERSSQDAKDLDFEHRLLMPDGSIKHLHVVAHATRDESGDLEYVGAVMDVTGHKQAEDALRQAQTDLARVNRVTTMGELTASLAHEVNQPIAAAVTNANTCLRWLMRDQPDLEEAREAAMRIVNNGRRAAEIISRVRLLFKKGKPERELVDVNEIIREMIVLLRGEATRYSISFRAELAPNLPQVMGDRVQLQQVFMNLMFNGIEAMKDVDTTRELAIKSQRAENEHILLSVSDTGMGLPSQQADQIFNAFFTTKVQGMGMGLSISRSIVESHGGRLWATDNSSRGASFYLSLPTNAAWQPDGGAWLP